jgi:pimeloyl-ACP methyl ester carboxylesterase
MDVLAAYKQSRNKLLEERGIQCQSRKAATNGPVKNVHYLELGTGAPLILIHGGGSHSSEWVDILRPLAEQFHLYVVDRPGCGLTDGANYRGAAFPASAVGFIASFMDAVGLEKASLMGQSMGGYFSICFALQHPERVSKLLLVGAPAGMSLWVPFVLRLLGTRGINRLLVKTIARPSVRNVRRIHRQLLVADVEKLSEGYIRHCYHSQLLPGYEDGFLSLLERVLTLKGWREDLYIGDQLHQLKMPVRFIWGDKDAFEKPESGMRKASAIRDVRFEVVENAGHCPWLDQPERCAHLTITLLQE